MRVLDCRKEMTAHMRKQIKAAGIKANVRAVPGSDTGIQVYAPSYEATFTADEQRFINTLAVQNELTAIRDLPINVEFVSEAPGMNFNFYLTEEGIASWRELALKTPDIHRRPNCQTATAQAALSGSTE